MASISAPNLLPVKQALFPLIRGTPSTVVLEYLGEKADRTLLSARKMLKFLLNIDITCEEPVRLMRSFKSLKNLFKPSENPLPIDFKYKGYKLTEIEIEIDAHHVQAKLVSQKANALFCFSYHKKTETCRIDASYRGDLPVWIKIGNPDCWLSDKGIPTGKVLTKLLIDRMGMTKENVKRITSSSMNPQTVVDVVHALLYRVNLWNKPSRWLTLPN